MKIVLHLVGKNRVFAHNSPQAVKGGATLPFLISVVMSAEAPTLEKLHEKLLILIPEMLELNHSVSVGKTLPISLETHREFRIA